MRKILILSLIVVFGGAPVSLGQDSYPPCSLTQLAAMLEFVPDYGALEEQMATVETLEEFLAFREKQLDLRDRSWELLPRCAEAIAYGDLQTRRYEMYSALSANFFWWTALEKPHPDTIFNPYREPFLDENYSEQYYQLRNEIEAKLADESSHGIPDGRLRKCARPDRETVYRVWNEYLLLLEAFLGMKTQRDLPEYGAAQVAWSDDLRARLPACEIAFEASILMRHDTFHRVLSFMLFGAGVKEDDIPYHAKYWQAFDTIEPLMAAVEDEYLAHESTWVFDSALASCTAAERDQLYEILQEHLALLNYARGAGGSANLIEFGRALVAWRTESWRHLPSCSEALEVGAAIRESAGDTVEIASDELAWLPAGTVESLETTLSGGAPLGQRLVDIDADRFDSEYRWHQPLAGEDGRPTCSREAIDDIADMVRGFLDVMEIGKLRNHWTGGLLAYLDARISWRMDNKASVPDCRIRFDLSNMLTQDALSLLAGGLPIVGPLMNPEKDTQSAIAALRAGTDAVGPRRPYSNNLRRCTSDELRRFSDDTEAYVSVIRDVAQVETLDDLFNQIERNLDWREEQWVNLLTCAENFEIGLLINQIASDMAAARALEMAGISPILNPYYRNRQRDIVELTERAQAIAGMIAEREDGPPASRDSSALPFCTDAQLEIVRALLSDFRKGPRLLLEGFTPQAVRSFSQYQDEWRPMIWSKIPACFEAVEVGLLMTRQSGDVTTISALDEVGARLEDHPFMHPRYCDFQALGTWLILLGAADASTQADVFSCVGLEAPQPAH